MGRPSKPWLRAQNQTWYVLHKGKQKNLGKDKDEAIRQWHALLANPNEEVPPPVQTEYTAKELFHEFLEWTELHRAVETLDWYNKHLKGFLKSLSDGETRLAEAVRPIDVIRWVDAHKDWSASYKRGAMVAVARSFNWAVKNGLLERNPVAHMEKPAAERREAYMTQSEFDVILSHVKDQQFKDLLTFSFNTGCRPQESRQLTAAMFEPDSFRFVIPAKQSKGKKRPRRIYLNPVAMEIAKRLVEKHPEGEIFRNTEDRPWTAFSINCRFTRLTKHVGKKFCLYLTRHGFTQKKLEDGVNHVLLAELLGHSNAVMVATTYSHMNQADSALRDAMND